MTDRELLEKAAKAAGIKLGWQDGMPYVGLGSYTPHRWNPLTNDGDAMRLAIDFDMSVEISEYEGSTYAYAGKAPRVHAMENWGDEKAAATRRAIVRAAAAIGEGKSHG